MYGCRLIYASILAQVRRQRFRRKSVLQRFAKSRNRIARSLYVHVCASYVIRRVNKGRRRVQRVIGKLTLHTLQEYYVHISHLCDRYDTQKIQNSENNKIIGATAPAPATSPPTSGSELCKLSNCYRMFCLFKYSILFSCSDERWSCVFAATRACALRATLQ